MINPCSLCECPNYCNEIGRCIGDQFRNVHDGDLADDSDDDELTAESVRLKDRKVKVPEKLTKQHQDFLKDFLNL